MHRMNRERVLYLQDVVDKLGCYDSMNDTRFTTEDLSLVTVLPYASSLFLS